MERISRKKDYYKALTPVAKIAMELAYHRKVEGLENIPDEPAIYAANHLKFTDSILIALAYTEHTGKAMRFGAKQEYFDGKGIDNNGRLGRLARIFVENTHQIPVVREGGSRNDFTRFSDAVAEAVSYGDSIGIHPEGTRSPDGRLYKFRHGVAKIALAQSLPIVPVGIIYEEPVPLARSATVVFGEPISIEEYQHLPLKAMPGALKVRHLSDRVEQEVADLTGQKRAGSLVHPYDKI